MAKQLQIRRGTTAHNVVFTGAIGEMTVDTQRKDLRLHDGVKQGGYEIPTIIEQQLPSADNDYTWFIKYSNGWCEQGGTSQTGTNAWIVLTMPVEMADNNYTLLITRIGPDGDDGSGTDRRYAMARALTTTSFKMWGAYAGCGFHWVANGLYKQGE